MKRCKDCIYWIVCKDGRDKCGKDKPDYKRFWYKFWRPK